MPQVEIVDGLGAVRAYLTAYPGLTGRGGAIEAGLHPGNPRSPSRGVIGGMELINPRTLTDISDDFRVSFRLRAPGSERGVKELVEYAARRLALAVLSLQDGAQVVQTRRGEAVRLLVAGETAGPTEAGDVGGEYSMVFDATFRCQQAAGQ